MSKKHGRELERKFEAQEKQRREKAGLQTEAPKPEVRQEQDQTRFNITGGLRE